MTLSELRKEFADIFDCCNSITQINAIQNKIYQSLRNAAKAKKREFDLEFSDKLEEFLENDFDINEFKSIKTAYESANADKYY